MMSKYAFKIDKAKDKALCVPLCSQCNYFLVSQVNETKNTKFKNSNLVGTDSRISYKRAIDKDKQKVIRWKQNTKI